MTDASGPLPWSWALVRQAASGAIVCVAIGSALGYLVAHQPAPGKASGPSAPPSDVPPPAGPAELALVAPLEPGATIAGCTVTRIDAVRDGSLAVVCSKGSAQVRLVVALAGEGGPPPPATSGRYAIFYAAPQGAGDVAPVCTALARILDANAAISPPPGLAPFRAR